jgi:hypothetical protein
VVKGFRYVASLSGRMLPHRRDAFAPDPLSAAETVPIAETGFTAAAAAAGPLVSVPVQQVARAEGFWRHRGLIAFSAGCAMAEAVVLTVFAPAAKSLAPQVTALPPLAVYHDLRWLFGYNRSWLEFAAGVLILVLGRSAVNTTMVRLSWPRDLRAPRPALTFAASMAFTLVAGILMVPIATLVFGVAVLPFSWPFLAAVPVLLALALPLSHGGVLPGWWRRLPPLRAAGWVVACFLEYSLLAVAITRLPPAWIVVVAALAGVVNARAWYGLTAAVARPARTRGHPLIAWIPIAPLAALSIIALAVGTTRLLFDMAAGSPPTGLAAASAGFAAATSQTGALAPPPKGHLRRPPVLVIAGFGSTCCHAGRGLQRVAPEMFVEQFSYLGVNAAGRPIPQGPDASNLPIQKLGDRIASQVWHLHAQSGRPVNLVAESEGSLGVYAMFARHPDVPVGSVVLLSPIVAPGQVSFPQAGQQGQGMASGYALSMLNRFVGALSPFGAAGAGRLLDSVDSVGARYAAASAERGTSQRWLALVPLADAVTLPACSLPSNVLFVPAFHGGLLGDRAVLGTVRRFLDGRRVSGPDDLRTAAEILSSAAAAWRMPVSSAPSPPCPA